MLSRERPRAPAGILPAPAPLPSLRDALQRRALLFGPSDADTALALPRGPWQAFTAALRRAAALLDPLAVA